MSQYIRPHKYLITCRQNSYLSFLLHSQNIWLLLIYQELEKLVLNSPKYPVGCLQPPCANSLRTIEQRQTCRSRSCSPPSTACLNFHFHSCADVAGTLLLLQLMAKVQKKEERLHSKLRTERARQNSWVHNKSFHFLHWKKTSAQGRRGSSHQKIQERP